MRCLIFYYIALMIALVSKSYGTIDVCNNVLQIHRQCVGARTEGPQGSPGKRGSPGPIGRRGLPGTVDYNIIDRTLEQKFQDTESRINQKLATCDEAMEVLEQKFRSRTITDCRKVARDDAKSTDNRGGVFDIYINTARMEVYCDLETDGGGWIVFQRRKDGSENFYRGWNDYVNGFGDKRQEFWIGLENLNKITSSGRYELRIELEDWSGNKRYAKYSKFNIDNIVSKYAMTVGGYSGDAGDAITNGNGMSFSTNDSDNDTSGQNCAVLFKGAWWYSNCHHANLNGFYFKGGTHSSHADGVEWLQFTGHYYSLKFVEMKIRSVA